MVKKLTLPLLLVCWTLTTLGQRLGEQSTAGFTNSRTYSNNDLSRLRPPLMQILLAGGPGINDATSLAVFDGGKILIGEKGSSITYTLFSHGGLQYPPVTTIWSQTVSGASADFRFVPAVGKSVAILGGQASIKAVNVVDGSVLWTDQVGDTNGRFPALTDNLAVYSGSNKVVVRTLSGTPFFEQAVTTAAAPLAVTDDSLYFLGRDRTLWAINLAATPVSNKWAPVPNIAGEGASLIATDEILFVNDPVGHTVKAINAATGQPAWEEAIAVPGTFATNPALALGSGRLFVFRSDNGSGQAAITAYDANTGTELWSITEKEAGLEYGFLASDTLYYYHGGKQIRGRDATTGALLWSTAKANVRGLTATSRRPALVDPWGVDNRSGELLVLLPNAVRVYSPVNDLYIPHMANGMGQTTLIVLSNAGANPAETTVTFLDKDGMVPVPVKGLGTKYFLNVIVPPNSSIGIQTLDQGGPLTVGWVRVGSDEPLHGTANFQYSEQEEIVREAAVADARPIGSANIFVSVGSGFNTGVAMANPSLPGPPLEPDEMQQAHITLRLLNSSGKLLASKSLDLEPVAHVARFVDELFADEVGTAFEGTLAIDSDVPIVITAIRTKDGVQISSYPVGQAVK